MRFKGQMFLSILGAVTDLAGAEALRHVHQALPGEVGEAVRSKAIVAGGWYPQSWYEQTYVTIAQIVPGSSPRALARCGQINDARGIYRFILLAVTPEMLVRLAPKIFQQYIDGCAMVIEADQKRARIKLTAVAPCSRALWQDFFGGMEALIELAGAKSLRSHVAEGGEDRDSRAVFDFFWV